MGTIYNRIQNNFTPVSNHALLDIRLSTKAYKLYAYMCFRIGTCPTWQFNEREIIKNFKEGQRVIRSGFKELIKYGYLVRTRTRKADGSFGLSDYEIFEKPANTESSPRIQNASVDNPSVDNARVQNDPYNNIDEGEERLINNKPKEENKSPPTPQEKKGALKFEGGVNRLESLIAGKAIEQAKKNAQGWDWWNLCQIYIEGINNGTREMPNDIKKAFPAWILKYTKGQKPGY